MLGREPYEIRFQGGTEIRGFIEIEKFLRQITPQNKLYCFSEKNLGVRCTLKPKLGVNINPIQEHFEAIILQWDTIFHYF